LNNIQLQRHTFFLKGVASTPKGVAGQFRGKTGQNGAKSGRTIKNGLKWKTGSAKY
jgi:hypothetical protein